MLRKAPTLPITFPGRGKSALGGGRGGDGGLDRVGGGVTGVSGHVGGCGGMAGGTGGGASRTFIRVTGGGMGGNCSGARCAARYLTTHPGTRCFDGFARPVVLRVLLLEEWKRMLGAIGGPERQRPVVLLVEPPGLFNPSSSQFYRCCSGTARP